MHGVMQATKRLLTSSVTDIIYIMQSVSLARALKAQALNQAESVAQQTQEISAMEVKAGMVQKLEGEVSKLKERLKLAEEKNTLLEAKHKELQRRITSARSLRLTLATFARCGRSGLLKLAILRGGVDNLNRVCVCVCVVLLTLCMDAMIVKTWLIFI